MPQWNMVLLRVMPLLLCTSTELIGPKNPLSSISMVFCRRLSRRTCLRKLDRYVLEFVIES